KPNVGSLGPLFENEPGRVLLTGLLGGGRAEAEEAALVEAAAEAVASGGASEEEGAGGVSLGAGASSGGGAAAALASASSAARAAARRWTTWTTTAVALNPRKARDAASASQGDTDRQARTLALVARADEVRTLREPPGGPAGMAAGSGRG